MERGAIVQDLDIAGAAFHLEPDVGRDLPLAELSACCVLERRQPALRVLGAMLDLTIVVAAA